MEKNNICMFCDSYEDGRCTNFGKEVNADFSCKFYRRTFIEHTCQQCGRKYQYIDSDAVCRDKFCCKACVSIHTPIQGVTCHVPSI